MPKFTSVFPQIVYIYDMWLPLKPQDSFSKPVEPREPMYVEGIVHIHKDGPELGLCSDRRVDLFAVEPGGGHILAREIKWNNRGRYEYDDAPLRKGQGNCT